MSDDKLIDVMSQAYYRARGGSPDARVMPGALLLGCLRAAGYAIVELPEPDYVDEADDDGHKGYGFNGGVFEGWYAHGGRVYAAEGDMSPKDARTLAAALLAAADVAERDGECSGDHPRRTHRNPHRHLRGMGGSAVTDYQPLRDLEKVADLAIDLAIDVRDPDINPTAIYLRLTELCATRPAVAAQTLMAYAAWFDPWQPKSELEARTREIEQARRTA